MNTRNISPFFSADSFCRLFTLTVLACFMASIAMAQDAAGSKAKSIGPGNVVVHSAMGGFILGYDIDDTGSEGLLAESVALANGYDNAAIETFDQKTGKIIKTVTHLTDSKSDFVALGVFGGSTGLMEYEHVSNLFVDKRVYGTISPLTSNKLTAKWTPPLTTDDIIIGMGASQGAADTAVLAFHNNGSFGSFVFSTNVAANTFGPVIPINDPIFDFSDSPVMAYDSATNQAVLGSGNGCPNCSPVIGTVDLATGAQSEFTGLGFGFINGIAVDPATGIACTATEIDFSVEFYNLATQSGIIVRIPGATNQSQSGQDVEFDPIHKWFFVGQEFTSTGRSGSSIQVFDEKGNYIESINGLSLPASPVRIALHPSARAGFVLVTPDLNELQSFTY